MVGIYPVSFHSEFYFDLLEFIFMDTLIVFIFLFLTNVKMGQKQYECFPDVYTFSILFRICHFVHI
jgi:hypothetical protein